MSTDIWSDVRKLEGNVACTVTGVQFNITRVTDATVTIISRNGREHNLDRQEVERAARIFELNKVRPKDLRTAQFSGPVIFIAGVLRQISTEPVKPRTVERTGNSDLWQLITSLSGELINRIRFTQDFIAEIQSRLAADPQLILTIDRYKAGRTSGTEEVTGLHHHPETVRKLYTEESSPVARLLNAESFRLDPNGPSLKKRIDKRIARNLRPLLIGKDMKDVAAAFDRGERSLRNVLNEQADLTAADVVVFKEKFGIDPSDLFKRCEKAFGEHDQDPPQHPHLTKSIRNLIDEVGDSSDKLVACLEQLRKLIRKSSLEVTSELMIGLEKLSPKSSDIEDLNLLLADMNKRRPKASFSKVHEVWDENRKKK